MLLVPVWEALLPCLHETHAHFLGLLQFAYKPWVDFVGECELFSLPPTCDPKGGPCARPVSANPWWLRQVREHPLTA